jgi:hypothetical protein
VLYLLHFGYQIGALDQARVCPAACEDQLHTFGFDINQGYHVIHIQQPEKGRHIDFVEDDDLVVTRGHDLRNFFQAFPRQTRVFVRWFTTQPAAASILLADDPVAEALEGFDIAVVAGFSFLSVFIFSP